MLSFVQSWFTAGANPVGVDFGTECLRMAQVEKLNGDCRLIAAASVDVPPALRHDSAARMEFFSTKLHELWTCGNFRGRRAVLGLPAAGMHVQHLRLPRMDDESIRKALPWESQGKLPIDPADALLRHIVAGEIYAGNEPRCEVILMAARRELVNGMLSAATRSRLEVVGMNVEPMALLDCFLNIYRRKSDAGLTNCYIDIGSTASRAIIARGDDILFARNLPIGGAHFSQAVATDFNITPDEARAVRFRLASSADPPPPNNENLASSSERRSDLRTRWPQAQREASASDDETPAIESGRIENAACGGVATLEAPPKMGTSILTTDRPRIERAIRAPLARLIEELSLCRRYHEATFPARPIERLIFVGGEARQTNMCRQIARELGISAQIGDPLVRMGRTTDVGIESGIDRRLPQPAWAVPVGLSMGWPGETPT